MRKEMLLEQVERVMTEFGCPPRKIRRKLEELELHHDVLKRAALREHLTEEGAEARASTQLGNPVTIGEEAAAAVRQASWWGRHPILGFIILPLATLLPALLVTVGLMFAVAFIRIKQSEWEIYFQGFRTGKTSWTEFQHLLKTLFNLQALVLTVLAIPFNWLARRSGSGLTWAAVPCLIYAAQGMFLQLHFAPRHSPVEYFFTTPNFWCGVGPLLIAVAGWWHHVRRVNRLPQLPEHLESQRTKTGLMELLNKPLSEVRIPKPAGMTGAAISGPKVNWFKKALRTPTYWAIPIIVVVGILILAGIGVLAQNMGQRRGQNRVNITPAMRSEERETALAEIKSRQANKVTHDETTINLRPYVNVPLNESVDSKKDLKENSLSELPSGTHVFGGVPFDVEGRVQLMGIGLEEWNRLFPAAVKGIPIGRKCSKIHLFHGECCNMDGQFRGAIAKLILHYADESRDTIAIKYGENVLDWWGPIFTSGASPEKHKLDSPDAELAWVGSNPWIQRYQKEFALRLYKATFTNPHPNLEVVSIEYISTMSAAAPFMLGMTVE